MKNSTFVKQLLELTLRVNPWLWNPALVVI